MAGGGRKHRRPDFGESLDDDPMVVPGVQGEEALEQLLQILPLEHLLLHDHVHHRLPEILVRIRRPLHDREALLHLPVHRAGYQLFEHRQPRRNLRLRRGRRRPHDPALRSARGRRSRPPATPLGLIRGGEGLRLSNWVQFGGGAWG